MPKKNSWRSLARACAKWSDLRENQPSTAHHHLTMQTSYMARTCHPYAPSSIAAPLAPLEATRVPSLGNRTRWNDTVSRHLQDYELSLEEATVVTQDRKEWRSFVLALCELGPRYHQCNVMYYNINSIARACFIFLLSTLMTSSNYQLVDNASNLLQIQMCFHVWVHPSLFDRFETRFTRNL